MSPRLIVSTATSPASAPNPVDPRFAFVAIQRTPHGNLHAGLFYRHPTEGLQVLHHPWHQYPLVQERQWFEFSWVENDWDPLEVDVVVARCDAVLTASPSLAYSLAYDATTHFDERGVLVQSNAVSGRPGLTCATFVLAILNGVGIDILDESDWPSTPGDQAWAKQILAFLKKSDPAYAKAMGSQKQAWTRYSPENVAAASGLSYPPPPGRSEVEPEGQLIASQV